MTIDECQRFYSEEIRFAAGGSMRDPQLEPVLKAAMTKGALMKIRSVCRDAHEPLDTCVVHRVDACLSSAENS